MLMNALIISVIGFVWTAKIVREVPGINDFFVWYGGLVNRLPKQWQRSFLTKPVYLCAACCSGWVAVGFYLNQTELFDLWQLTGFVSTTIAMAMFLEKLWSK